MSEMNETEMQSGSGPSGGQVDEAAKYWRSLEDFSGDPEFLKQAQTEFLSSPLREEKEEGWARREFLKLMGASIAMSSAACVRRPIQKIVPYNKQPEEVTFGVDNFYSSTWFDGTEGLGLLVRTREGRPLKVEGNPHFPLNKGGMSARGHAHILALYDPDRLRGPKRNVQNRDKGKERSNRDTVSTKWETADEEIVKALNAGGVAVLTGNISSPSTRAVVNDFGQAFGARHYTWDALTAEDVRLGQRESYGTDLVPSFRLDKAKVIVSVDADFLGSWLMPTTFQRQFSAGRRDPAAMSKLIVFDSNYSLTGANADIRVKIKPSLQLQAVLGLAHEIIIKKKATKFAGSEQVAKVLQPFAQAHLKLGIQAETMAKMADALIAAQGQSLILAGGLSAMTDRTKSLQIATAFLNSALENDGVTVDYAHPLNLDSSSANLMNLIAAIDKGDVKTLIIHGANPVYASPLGARFVAALKKVAMVVSTADRNDETAKFADYVLPDPHSMETWNDAEYVEGLLCLQQPTIRPLYDTRSFQLSLMTWAFMAKKGPKRLQEFETYYDYLRNYWRTELQPRFARGQSFEAFWEQALQAGYVGDWSEPPRRARNFRVEALSSVFATHTGESGYEVVMYASKALSDGSLANVSWLQELPDPISKICWDNYVSVSLATAQKEGLAEGALVRIKVGEDEVTLPTHVQPGLHDEVLAVAVGYGRTDAGKVGNQIGVNVYPLATLHGDQIAFSGLRATLQSVGKKVILAATQSHHSMEGRKIVVEATQKEYVKDAGANNHHAHVWSIWGGHQYNGNKWAMAVDLNTCTGCNACIVACQSENNIPVVGKKYVIQGREMHWMRIDRYYVGDPAQAETVFQPVMCQQCDNAPCETVCPVLATVHSSEGLNDMVYNRCVGTRYCANNCPYKVRRFNWFHYASHAEKPLHLALNPDVTVRTRGVMEKCTFCVHRIKARKIEAKNNGTSIKDGDIKTACQQSCPSQAIVFGDINDPGSAVANLFKEKRSYALLEEFGAAPMVRYMTKIRNNDQDKRVSDSSHGGHA